VVPAIWKIFVILANLGTSSDRNMKRMSPSISPATQA
jgi:hypothetical protein